MIERAAPVTDRGRVGDGAADVPLRAPSGIGEAVAKRETGRDSRRERATCAVGMTAVDPRRAEFVKAVTVEQQIDDFLP